MNSNPNKIITPALQSIVNGVTGQVIGYEVLARWTDGIFSFIPHHNKHRPDWAQADKEVVKSLIQSAAHMSELKDRFFINVGEETLANDANFDYWKDKLVDLLWLVNLPITLEIVEDVKDVTLESRWSELEQLGVTLALDDFGRKNSTMDRLQRYEWSFCKIDIQDDVVTTEVLEFCNANSISMIAERVETEQLSQKAFQHGLEQHQGFLYGLPFFLRETTANEAVV